MVTNNVRGIDIIVRKKCYSSVSVQVLEDGSVHVQGGVIDATEQRHLRQIGELVKAAVDGTLQCATMLAGAGGSPCINIMKRAVSTIGVNGH